MRFPFTIFSAVIAACIGSSAQGQAVPGDPSTYFTPNCFGYPSQLRGNAPCFYTGIRGTTALLDGGATAPGTGSIAYGNMAYTPSNYAIAIGQGAHGIGQFSLGVGVDAYANGDFSTAIGAASTAAGQSSLAAGSYAIAAGNNAVALGSNASATGANAVAIGSNANASAPDSVAMGSGSVADQASTVSVGSVGGERRITNVAAGVGATDAVNVAQLNAATAGVAAFQSNISALGANVATLDQRLDQLFASRSIDRREMRSGVASAVAMANAPMPSAPGRTSYIVNGATFRGQQAVGMSMMHRFNTEVPLALGAGLSYAGGKNTAGRVSVAGEF